MSVIGPRGCCTIAWRRARIVSLLLLVLAAAGGWWAWQAFAPDRAESAALEAWTKHHLPEAKTRILAGLERSPRHPRLLFLAARVARRLGELDDAQQRLAACADSKSLDPREISLENSLLGVQRHGLRAGQDADLESLAGERPGDRALIYEAMALGFLKMGRPTAAQACLDKSLQVEPDNPVALRQRGLVKDQLMNTRLTVLDFRRAVELEPAHEEGRRLLADSLYRTGRFTEALPLFTELHERQPDNASILIGLAGSIASAGDLEKSRTLLEQLLAKHPNHPVALLERGRIALELNQVAEAEVWLRKSLAADPSDRRTNHLLYQALQLQGKDAEAKEQLARSQRLLADLARLGEILADSLNQRPNDPDLHHELGSLYLRNSNTRQAIFWLERALGVDPSHRATHRTLAEYYDRVGPPERAAHHRGKVRD